MDMEVYQTIRAMADRYAIELQNQVYKRIHEMENDDNSHYLIYRVLGVSDDEGHLVDLYQNKGRFLYEYAGTFLENAATICIKSKYPEVRKVRITNTISVKPRQFEIDCLVGNLAHEIKWRDATTDGDHITKEHTRIKAISANGYTPVRVMFYYPQREQAIRIQETLETLYHSIGGQYYYGDSAWKYIRDFTGIDLHEMLEQIAESREDRK